MTVYDLLPAIIPAFIASLLLTPIIVLAAEGKLRRYVRRVIGSPALTVAVSAELAVDVAVLWWVR